MQPAQGRRTKLAGCADAMNFSWPESVSQSFNPCQSRDARGPGDAALLVGGLLKGLLLAPRQPGLILFCQLGSFGLGGVFFFSTGTAATGASLAAVALSFLSFFSTGTATTGTTSLAAVALSFLSFFSGFSAIWDEPASPQVYSTPSSGIRACNSLGFSPLRRDLPAASSPGC